VINRVTSGAISADRDRDCRTQAQALVCTWVPQRAQEMKCSSPRLDVSNELFGNFHVNWAGTRWFSAWCVDYELPYPFIGWVSGCNDGDQCELGTDNEHTRRAREWCRGLEEKHPEIAELGNELRAKQDMDLSAYLYPHNALGKAHALSEEEWELRAVAAWYAILKNGIEHGDTLAYC
jgi:hypothetical protein